MTLKPEDFLTRSLKEQPWGLSVARILSASLSAVDSRRLISEQISISGTTLKVKEESLDLLDYERIFLLSIGKAATPMAFQAGEILGKFLHKALILTKYGNKSENQIIPARYELFYGGHPIPDQSSRDSTAAILEEIINLSSKDLVIILLSGGGSALFTLPAAGISLEDLQQTNQVLLNCGASILEFNTVRKHISGVKGGLLTRMIYPARIITLALNDVPNNRIDMISSGISAPDPTTYKEALAIIDRYGIKERLPRSVIEYLELGHQGEFPETPKPGDEIFDQSFSSILADNGDAIHGAVEQAELEGLDGGRWPGHLAGEAKSVGKSEVEDILRMIKNRDIADDVVLILGGETTVTLPEYPPPGKGGRNLELALGTVKLLKDLQNVCLITLATDGEDGPTDAAGAIVTGETFQRAINKGMSPDEYLTRHDSYTFFDSLGDLIKIGPTQTNVNDLLLFLNFRGAYD